VTPAPVSIILARQTTVWPQYVFPAVVAAAAALAGAWLTYSFQGRARRKERQWESQDRLCRVAVQAVRELKAFDEKSQRAVALREASAGHEEISAADLECRSAREALALRLVELELDAFAAFALSLEQRRRVRDLHAALVNARDRPRGSAPEHQGQLSEIDRRLDSIIEEAHREFKR
jgi:hypothetical protein